MFKVFGVSDERDTTEKMEIKNIESRHEKGEDIEIHPTEERDHDTDIGQIAVDILDTADSIIIIAPIA